MAATVPNNPEYNEAIRRSIDPSRFSRSAIRIPEETPGLPRLEYNILHHKKKLFFVTGALVFEGSLLPIVLFYPLSQKTDLRYGIIFAIITSFFGIISGLEFAHRSWRLIHKEDKYRPLDGKRWRFDFTHWTLCAAYTVMTGILIGASIPEPPFTRILAMPLPIFFIQIGVQMIVTGYMAARGIPSLCKISSSPKGAPQPPMLLTIVEDIVGVDGGGARRYRANLMERYRVSRRFRVMLKQLNLFWGIGAVLNGAAIIAVIWETPQDVAYGIGWGEPLGFVIIWTIITVIWVRRGLRNEKKHWAADFREKSKTFAMEAPPESVSQSAQESVTASTHESTHEGSAVGDHSHETTEKATKAEAEHDSKHAAAQETV
ncbi:hypothetical protein F4780DRAFT_608873 [Xylariomycetidae sp. FL0641]|nr:hypothetical protein F4780DRAFT_608873 [Xylariomycetidae sp. FL0641]